MIRLGQQCRRYAEKDAADLAMLPDARFTVHDACAAFGVGIRRARAKLGLLKHAGLLRVVWLGKPDMWAWEKEAR